MLNSRVALRTKVHVLTVLAVTILVSFLASSSHAWTPVDKSFHFTGMLCKDTCVLSFWETCWGERECNIMHHVYLAPEGHLIRDSLEYRWRGKAIVTDEMKGYDLAWVLKLRDQDSLFCDPFNVAPKLRVRPPAFDSVFNATWGDSLRNVFVTGFPKALQDSSWLRTNLDHPIFENEVELVYAYPLGIYKNYKIIEVIQTGRYFFILTYQPIGANSETFDGVLIYRMKGRW